MFTLATDRILCTRRYLSHFLPFLFRFSVSYQKNMQSFHTSIQLWVLVALLVWVSSRAQTTMAQTTCNLTEPLADDFVCTDNATEGAGTQLIGNSVALETLRGWCAADPRCAELYGQSGAPNLALFLHLFQTTLTVPASSVVLETPLHDLLCNLTVQEFLMVAWQLTLKAQILDSTSSVCDVNERPQLDSTTGIVTCVCQAGKTCDHTSGALVVQIIVVVAVLLAVVVIFATRVWNVMRMQTMLEVSAAATQRRPSASMGKPGPGGSGSSSSGSNNTDLGGPGGSVANASASSSLTARVRAFSKNAKHL
jgi:hypothetical protein